MSGDGSAAAVHAGGVATHAGGAASRQCGRSLSRSAADAPECRDDRCGLVLGSADVPDDGVDDVDVVLDELAAVAAAAAATTEETAGWGAFAIAMLPAGGPLLSAH